MPEETEAITARSELDKVEEAIRERTDLGWDHPVFLGAVGQHRLHDCTLELEGERFAKASLFPFFDRQGTTRALMLTWRGSADIRLVEWRPGCCERRWVRPPRMRLRVEDFDRGPDDFDLDVLWHFDPWWELGEERYAGNEAVAPLKETNVPGYDESVKRLWFSPDLGRVTWVGRGSGEEATIRRYQDADLRVAAEQRYGGSGETAGRGAGASESWGQADWQLRPFWQ